MNKFTQWKFGLIIIPLMIVLGMWSVKVEVEIVPESKIRVVDRNGRPMSEVQAVQSWFHYDYEGVLETWRDQDRQTTDENGEAFYVAKSIRVTLLEWIFAKLYSIKRLPNPHSSFGADAFITTVNIDSEGARYDEIVSAARTNRVLELVSAE